MIIIMYAKNGNHGNKRIFTLLNMDNNNCYINSHNILLVINSKHINTIFTITLLKPYIYCYTHINYHSAEPNCSLITGTAGVEAPGTAVVIAVTTNY